jgi:hypothetical protein
VNLGARGELDPFAARYLRGGDVAAENAFLAHDLKVQDNADGAEKKG